ncbi:MAG: TolC family protein [Sandaracinaceae bacterium]|nr:TolC family protein [Sandaracinaceae bacterium]
MTRANLRPGSLGAALLAIGLFAGCAARYETSVRHDLARAAPRSRGAEAAPAPRDGRLESYVTLALAASPELRERYARWRAETLRIAPARALPDPMIGYAFFALPLDVQRHRLMASQSFPWPTRLTAAADAQSARAAAAQLRFEARALDVAARVADAWWRLWLVERVARVWREQLELLGGLAESLRARLEASEATLAELARVELSRARLADAIDGLDEQAQAARAALRAAVGGELPEDARAEGEPALGLPAESAAALADAVRAHPFLRSFERLAEAGDDAARAAEGARFPSFTVGVEWTDGMPMPGNTDPMLGLQVALTIPLWQEAYDDAQRAAEADAEAERAAGASAELDALAELAAALSEVRDADRRARVTERTLLPQAQSAFESVIGAYTVGRASVADLQLAQRELLELAVELERARAEHGRAWARLERVVGRRVARAE